MASETRRTKLRVDSDGVRTLQTSGVRKGAWLLVLAIGLVGLVVVVRLGFNGRSDERAEPAARSITVRSAAYARAARPAAKPLHPAVATDGNVAPPPVARVQPPRAPAQDAEPVRPSEDDPVFGKAPPEERSGLALFPPPGTKPMMFHPDYSPVDEGGVSVPLPADRVVPPEMAPPGLPIQMLEVPENQGGQDPRP